MDFVLASHDDTHTRDGPPVARRIASMASMASLASALPGTLKARVAATLAERHRRQQRSTKATLLAARMAHAETYGAWQAAADALDELRHEHDDERDDDDESEDDALMARLHELEAAVDASRAVDPDDADACGSTVRRLMHLVRTALSRELSDASDASSSARGRAGTRRTGTRRADRFVEASVALVDELLARTRSPHALPTGLTHRAMLDQLLLARRSYGRSALVLSGGSVYGMAHIGVLKALFEQGLLPRIISGTSAGSIVASMICTRTDDEVPELMAEFAHGDLAVFTDADHPDSWRTHVGRALRVGAWHDSRHIARVMRERMGDMTFQEAFNRTRRILNITVSSKPGLRLPSILNYLTAPDVIVWSAVVASCSIPGVFDARPLLVRDADSGEHVPWDPAEQLWIDGSLDNDVPVERLGSMLNVNHFIVSQTNPHIALLVDDVEAPKTALGHVADTLAWLGKSEAVFCLESLVDAGVCRGGAGMLLQMLSQPYTADINILPRMSLARWGTHLIRNPTTEFMLEACRVGEHATWPQIRHIGRACAVEQALDRAVHVLRERIAFSDSQVNLRRFLTAREPGTAPGWGPDGWVRRNQSAVARNKSSSPTAARSRSPTVHRLPKAQAVHGHRRRGSVGSLQLPGRRWHHHDLDTILSDGSGRECGHGHADTETSDSEPAASLAARRGMDGMALGLDETGTPLVRSESYGGPAPVHRHSLSLSHSLSHSHNISHSLSHSQSAYYRTVKQNSLQQLPMGTPRATPRQTPRVTPRVTPRHTPRHTPHPHAQPPVFWKGSSTTAYDASDGLTGSTAVSPPTETETGDALSDEEDETDDDVFMATRQR